MRYRYTVEELKKVVNNSLSVAQVCRELGIRAAGGNFQTVNRRIRENNIDISHFTGQGWNVGKDFKHFGKKYSIKEILIENSPYRSSDKLRKRLINEGYKKKQCECCKRTKWLDQGIKLELHHINGINTDNRIENLQILCPNCHSYTDNFRGGNIDNLSALSEKRDVEYRKFKETLTHNGDGNLERSSIKSNRERAET